MLQLCPCWQSQIQSPQPMWMLPRCGGRTGQTINFTNWAGLFPVWKLSTGKLLLKITFFCRALFKKRACASVRKSLDMAWSIMGIMGNNFAQTTPLKLALENFPPFQNRCRKNQPMWWSFPDLIMTRSSAFLAILHHCRACTKRSRCPSLWEGRLSHSSAQTRYNYKDFFVVEILYLPVCVCECQSLCRERPGWGCSPCTRPGGDTSPSCARTLTYLGLRLSARRLSGQFDIQLHLILGVFIATHKTKICNIP